MTSGDAGEIARRKAEHLSLAASGDVEGRSPAGWEDVHLVHDALPEIDAASVDLGTTLLRKRLALPLVISAMTGGHERARGVNEVLATAADRHGLAIGVGSQRAALRDPALASTYAVVRERAPRAFVMANLGISQLVAQDEGPPLDAGALRRAVEMVRADALVVHLNYLEECVQPEGQTRATGAARALRAAVRAAKVPVIAKETGAGLSREVALRLRALGVAALDTGGRGGTSFAAIEALRAEARGDQARRVLGERFREWGVPTAVSVVGAAASRLPVIATGGVRSGLDAAKAIALGAVAVGVGRPLLQRAMEGEGAVDEWIRQFALELRTALFLSGARRLADLRRVPRVVSGETRVWLDALGYLVRSRTRS